jgi:cytochrome P450
MTEAPAAPVDDAPADHLGGAVDPYADFDPMEQFTGVAGTMRNPYPGLWAKREQTPVERTEGTDWQGRHAVTYTVYPFDLVSQVLRDNHSFSNESIRETMGRVMGDKVLVGLDEPEHKRQRNLVAGAFRSKALTRWEDTLVRKVVDEMVDRFVDRGRAELVRELTFQYPVQIIAEILGIPRADYPRFRHWAMAIINMAARPEAGWQASQELRAYMVEVVEDRRRNPRDDVITDLVTARIERDDGTVEALDDEEIYSFVGLLLPAGAETTYRASGNLLFGLLTHPDQLDAVRADRSLLTQAVEEGLRWENALLVTSRTCLRDTEVGGHPIPAGAAVIAHIGAANHDPRYWDDPDSFDIFRPPRQAAIFGFGPHMCLGMHLARMEVRVAVDTLLDRLPDLALDPEAEDVHIHGELFRSPLSLPVVF